MTQVPRPSQRPVDAPVVPGDASTPDNPTEASTTVATARQHVDPYELLTRALKLAGDAASLTQHGPRYWTRITGQLLADTDLLDALVAYRQGRRAACECDELGCTWCEIHGDTGYRPPTYGIDQDSEGDSDVEPIAPDEPAAETIRPYLPHFPEGRVLMQQAWSALNRLRGVSFDDALALRCALTELERRMGDGGQHTITAVDDLDALPDRTVILTRYGAAAQKSDDVWEFPNEVGQYLGDTIDLPATVLWSPPDTTTEGIDA